MPLSLTVSAPLVPEEFSVERTSRRRQSTVVAASERHRIVVGLRAAWS